MVTAQSAYNRHLWLPLFLLAAFLYRRLMDYVKKLDPGAFVTVYSVSEIHYKPKKR